MKGFGRIVERVGTFCMLTLQPARCFLNVRDIDLLRMGSPSLDRSNALCIHYGIRPGQFQRWLGMFQAVVKKELFGNLQRRVEVLTGWHDGPPDIIDDALIPTQEIRPGYVIGMHNTAVSLEAIHDAFRGQRGQDGMLCYENGVEILKPFAG